MEKEKKSKDDLDRSICEKNFNFEVELIKLVNSIASNSEFNKLILEFVHGYTQKEIEHITVRTIDQNKCELWFQIRQIRYTASIIGKILKVKSNKARRTILNYHINPSEEYKNSLNNNFFIRYGRETEIFAFNEFARKNPSIILNNCGAIILEQYPFVAVTPDGIGYLHSRNEYFTIEIKCPSAPAKNDGPGERLLCDMKLLDNSNPKYEGNKRRYLQPLDTEYLDMHAGDDLVDKTHTYYVQCQLQMYAANVNYCFFIVWCKNAYLPKIYTVKFIRNDEFIKTILERLTILYKEDFIDTFIYNARIMYDKYLYKCNIDHDAKKITRIPLYNSDHYMEAPKKRMKKMH